MEEDRMDIWRISKDKFEQTSLHNPHSLPHHSNEIHSVSAMSELKHQLQ